MALFGRLLSGSLLVASGPAAGEPAAVQETREQASATAAEPVYDATQADADLEVVVHARGPAYTAARARLGAHAGLAGPRIAARLETRPPPAEQDRLWALLAELAPPAYVAEVSAKLRPPPPPPPPPPSQDPRDDRRWAQRDQALSYGMIGTGVAFGLSLTGLFLSLVLPPALSDGPSPDAVPCLDCYPVGALIFAGVVPVTGIAFAAVSGARARHRRPLRAFQARLAGAGLLLRF